MPPAEVNSKGIPKRNNLFRIFFDILVFSAKKEGNTFFKKIKVKKIDNNKGVTRYAIAGAKTPYSKPNSK